MESINRLDAWDEFALEPEQCCAECSGEIVAGVRWPADPGGATPPAGWSWVERCDECRRFGCDDDAAQALIAAGVGTRCRVFPRTLDAPAGQSCAINVRPDFPLGAQFRLTRPVKNPPHFVARRGLTGTVPHSDVNGIWLHMHQPVPGAESWDNAVHFGPGDDGRPPLYALLRVAKLIASPVRAGASDE